MLIFNCSQAFAAHIEPKKAGPAPLFGEAPSPHPSEDLPFLIDTDGQPPRHVQQWLVHFVRIRRKPCAVAMDIATRYAMVFGEVKKGDAEGFLNAFTTRLVNEMTLAASEVGVIADFELSLARFLERHSRFQFVRRMERSTLAHLKEAIWNFDYRCEMADRVLTSHEECALVDAQINATPRTVKGRKGFFVAHEEMLCAWLGAYAGLTPDGERAVRQRLRDQARRALPGVTMPPVPETTH